MNTRKFAIIGGDNRSIALAKLLHEEGHFVNMFGFGGYEKEKLLQSEDLYEAIKDVDYIIGPIPCSHNGILLNTPFHSGEIFIDEIFRLAKPGQVFIAGYIKREVFELAAKYGINMIDLLKQEELLVLNAIPTAEGAIKIAIEETDFTLHGSNIMILGYGRIGKILAKMLSGIGSNVTVCVNKPEAAASVRSVGLKAVYSSEMNEHLQDTDIIFNTVPKILLDFSNVKYVNKNTLIIDLASPPYGVDYNAVQKYDIKTLYTNSLPGKIAPYTTAKYILETVDTIISDWEVPYGTK